MDNSLEKRVSLLVETNRGRVVLCSSANWNGTGYSFVCERCFPEGVKARTGNKERVPVLRHPSKINEPSLERNSIHARKYKVSK